MSELALIGLFFGALALMSVSAFVLVSEIERVGARLHFTPGLLGIIVALGADAPEISSAGSALAAGHREVGVGVVLGSNVFNLAALLGLTALTAKRGLRVGRRGLLLSGGAAVLVTVVAALLVLRVIGGGVALGLVFMVLVPYAIASALRESQLRRWPLPSAVRDFLCDALGDVDRDARSDEGARPSGVVDALAIVPALVAVVVGGIGIVKSAVALGGRWHVPHPIVGVLVLATVTGAPNLVAAVHLARRGRGPAVVSEALNSNSLNVACGLCLPSVVLGRAASPSAEALIALGWLVGMTVLAVVLASRSGGLRRGAGGALVALYLAFALTVVVV